MTRVAILAPTFSLLTLACEPDLPEVRYFGERVTIGTTFEDPLCAGDIAQFDRTVQQYQTILGLDDADPIRLYLYDPYDDFDDVCRDGIKGCFTRSGGYAAASRFPSWIAQHELAHAVAARVGDPQDRFVEEGGAVMLENRVLRFAGTRPTDNVGLDFRQTDVYSVAHFLRWSVEEVGLDAFRDLMGRNAKDGAQAYENAFGMSLSEAEDRYFEEAPWAFPRHFSCDAPELLPTGPGEWRHAVSLDCEASDTRHQIDSDTLVTQRVITVKEDGVYNVWVDEGSRIGFMMCEFDKVAEPPVGWPALPVGWPWLEETRMSAGDADAAWSRAGGEVHQLRLAPGQYELRLSHDGLGDEDVSVKIWPALQTSIPP